MEQRWNTVKLTQNTIEGTMCAIRLFPDLECLDGAGLQHKRRHTGQTSHQHPPDFRERALQKEVESLKVALEAKEETIRVKQEVIDTLRWQQP